jgi:hypothetical protein
MKPIHLILILLCVTSVFFPQSMKVTSPKAGDILQAGNSYTITWTTDGKADPNVKINIFHDAITAANFLEQLTSPNDGQAKWMIPNTYTPGTYLLRIKTADNKIIADSPLFKIIQKGNKGSAVALLPALINRPAVNPNARITIGTKPYILSFFPDEFSRKRAPLYPGAANLFLVKLNFYWKDDNGDLKNGRWYFSYEGGQSGFSGSCSGSPYTAAFQGSFEGKKGSVIGLEVMYINGAVNDKVKVTFAIEDEHGNFSEKVTGTTTLTDR